MDKVKKDNKMGNRPILPLLVTMALPAMLSMLVQSLYNIVDSIFVSRLGEEALRAVTIAFPIQQLKIAFFVGTGIGVNSLIARSLGKQDQEGADSAGKHGFLLALITAIIFGIVGLIMAKPFYNHFTDNAYVMNAGMSYLKIVTVFSFGHALQIMTEKTLQATGDMIHPMIIQMLGAISNIILDPILIFGLFGVPAMGVTGAAIATVLGQCIGFSYGLYVLVKKDHEIDIGMKNFKWNGSSVKQIYGVGIPSIIMTSIASFMVMFMNSILKPFSETAITILGAYFRFQSFVYMPVFGLTQGAMPIIGYNYGAGNKQRMLDTMKYAMIIAVGITAIGTILFQTQGRLLLSIFDATEEMYVLGIPAFKRISLSFIFAAINIIISTTFQAMGLGFNSLLLSIFRQIVIIIPLFKWFSTIELDLVWFAFPIAEVAALVMSIIIFMWVYRKKICMLVPIDERLEDRRCRANS